jgi:LmbE family N-acetylglucosaminyl deacetylase
MNKKFVSICIYLWIISLCFCVFVPVWEVKAQVRPVYDYGAIGLGQLLKRLNNTKSVMHIGAHPDDEDSGLLAYLARGENARTAYLSLTRGEGGQNIIGKELSEALGVIRTEELLQARRLDGAAQYFTRAIDFGFSKTLAEAKEKWDEKVILCDAVRAIRAFRPLVVISRFSGTPADGHGQHQFAGYIAPLAVNAAADETQCKDSGQPWQVQKFYISQGFRDTKEPTLRVNTGQYDFLLGRSYVEIAMEGRSQHKTQEQGVLEVKGERFSGLNLVESKATKAEKETSVFDGIDISLGGIAKTYLKDEKSIDEFTKNQLAIIKKSAERALREYEPNNPQKIVPALIEGAKAVGDLFASYMDVSLKPESTQREREKVKNEADIFFASVVKTDEFAQALKIATGIQIDALTDKESVAPGENFLASVKIFFPKTENIKVKGFDLSVFRAKNDFVISKAEEPKDANQNPFRREIANASAYFDVKVPTNEKPTEPYFLENKRDNFLYNWNEANANGTLPFQTPFILAAVTLEIGGEEIIFNQRLEYRFADDIRGEIRRNLSIVPVLSVSLDQKLLIVPQSEKAQTKRVVMSITNNSSKPVSGNAALNIVGAEKIDWKYSASSPAFNLKNKGEKTAITFDVTIPANTKAGNYQIYAQAMFGEALATNEMNVIAYPHIQTHRYYTRAETKVNVLDLKTAPVKIGYIAGSGDRVIDAIRQMNFDVEMLDENYLTNGDLSRFDTIVVGIRASQVRPDFIANHQRLLDYAKNGGTLLVQYQLPVYQSLLPFPAQMGARVTDENAKVAILEPTNPVFNFPNKITDKDFENWVQERNLYALTNMDANYKPLLESHDAGEAENKGGLTVAEIGKGKYIYCSYAFFRQLPAGNAGAHRLFANLLSLPKAKS